MEDKVNIYISGLHGNSVSGSGSTPPPQPVSTTTLPLVMNMNTNVGNSEGTTLTAAVTATMATLTPGSREGGGTGQTGNSDLFGNKKKRGRPRKYDSEGNLNVKYQQKLLSAPPPPTQGFTLSPISHYSEFSSKRGRGRSSGSGNWQLLAHLGEMFANTAGGDFIPHVLTVHTGEDVAAKIFSFAQMGPRGICILSANGAISNVAIRQPGPSGGILTYEGRFEILSLSGSFTVSDNSGIRIRNGGLSVSLAGPDGRVIGGSVAGQLTAAGPIQIVVGSFMPNGHKTQKRKYHREHKVASPISGASPDTMTAARPISQANPEGENFLTPNSQLPEQNHRESFSITSDKQDLDATPHWNGSEEFSDQRPSPDINISLPDE